MRFRLAPRSMTLDDLELYKFDFSENFAGFRRFVRQQQLNERSELLRCNPLKVLFSIMFLALISRKFLL